VRLVRRAGGQRRAVLCAAPAGRALPAARDQGRLPPLRAQLLPPLPARSPTGRGDRHLDEPHRLSLRGAAVSDRPNTLLFHVDHLGFGELTCHSGGAFRGATTERDECLWPDDPWYDPERDPVSRMLEIRCGDSEATEREQLTMDVRRGCDIDYLRR